MGEGLYDLLVSAQRGNKNSLYIVIDKFRPLTNKYVNQLNYYCAETDMMICLIELVQRQDWTRFDRSSEGAVVNYIAATLRNKKVDLYRKYVEKEHDTIHLDSELLTSHLCPAETSFELEWSNVLTDLSDRQKKIIVLTYAAGYSDSEIAQKVGVSRQAIHKARKHALEKIRKKICQNYEII